MIFPRKFGDRLVNVGKELTSPEPVIWRPLNFGADTRHSFSKITKLQNIWVDIDGWKLRPGIGQRFTGKVPVEPGETVIDYVDMGFMSAEYLTLSAITTKGIYNTHDGNTWSRAKWYQDKFSGTNDAGTITISGTGFYFRAGMRIVTTTGATATIASVAESTVTTIVVTEVVGDLGAAPEFSVYYDFANPEPYGIQWCKGSDVIYLVDLSEGIFKYNGMYLSRFPIFDENRVLLAWSAATIAYHEGRLILGNVTGNSTAFARAIYWSDVLDVSLFRSINYVIFTASTGPVLRIASIENHLIVATQDDLYVGKPFTGDLSYTLPWIFRKLETLGNVPVGQGAILSVLNSVIYAGENDLYMLSFKDLDSTGAFVVKPMESPTYQKFMAGRGSKHKLRLMYEPTTQCVLVVPAESVNDVLVISTRTGAESTWQFPTQVTAISPILFTVRETYETMLAKGRTYADELALGHSYMYYLFGFGTPYVALSGVDGSVYVFTTAQFDELAPGVVTKFNAVVTTGRIDFDYPDDAKTMYKLSIRGDGGFTADVTGYSGSTAKHLGQMIIAGNGENELHFRLSGNRLGLQIVLSDFNNGGEPVKIDELAMMVKFIGEKIRRSED